MREREKRRRRLKRSRNLDPIEAGTISLVTLSYDRDGRADDMGTFTLGLQVFGLAFATIVTFATVIMLLAPKSPVSVTRSPACCCKAARS